MATLTSRLIHKSDGEIQYIAEKWTFSADGSQALGSSMNEWWNANNLIGGYLFTCEIKTSVDDAVTVVLTSGIGAKLINHTTTAATAGEFATILDRYTINSAPTLTLSGMSAGTAVIEVVVTKK